MGSDVGTEPLVIAIVRPFAEQVQVKIGEDRPKRIRIDEFPRVSLAVFHAETIRESALPAGEASDEKTIGVNPLHRRPARPARRCVRSTTQADMASGRKARTTQRIRGRRRRRQLMNAQDRERVPVVAMDDQVNFRLRRRGYRTGQHRHFCRLGVMSSSRRSREPIVDERLHT